MEPTNVPTHMYVTQSEQTHLCPSIYSITSRSVRAAEWLPLSDHGVPGSNPAGSREPEYSS